MTFRLFPCFDDYTQSCTCSQARRKWIHENSWRLPQRFSENLRESTLLCPSKKVFVAQEEASSADPGEDVLVDTDDGAVIKRVDDDFTLYSVNPAIPYPRKSDQNTLVIRGRVLGVVSSSDRPSKDDLGILEVLFIDEIREFNEDHGVNG